MGRTARAVSYTHLDVYKRQDFDRNTNECRDKHLDEIVATRTHYLAHREEVKGEMEKYRNMTFPGLD